MATHRIDLTDAYRNVGGNWRGHGKAFMAYRGERIGVSREPLFAAARYLLKQGLASEDDTIETWRGEMQCLRSKVGLAATLTVCEPDEGGIFHRTFRPFEDSDLLPLRNDREASDDEGRYNHDQEILNTIQDADGER